MNETLTDRQFAFIMLGAAIGQDLVYIPQLMAKEAGTGGWVTMLIATCIAAYLVYLFVYLGYVHKNKTLYDYSQELVGKYITYIFAGIYILYFFTIFSLNCRVFSEYLNIFTMPHTPVIALCLLLLLVILLVLIKRLRVLARLCEIYMSLVIIGALIISTIIIFQGRLVNMRPFFEVSEVSTYIKAIPTMQFPVVGIEILGCVAICKNNTKKVFKYSALSAFLYGACLIYVFEACLSVIGVDDIIHYDFTLFNVLRSIDVPYLDFLKRLDGIALMFWFMSVFCHLSLFAYGTIFYINKIFKRISYNLLVFIVLILAFFVFLLPQTYYQAKEVLIFISNAMVITSVLIPMILLIITKVKKYDKNI